MESCRLIPAEIGKTRRQFADINKVPPNWRDFFDGLNAHLRERLIMNGWFYSLGVSVAAAGVVKA